MRDPRYNIASMLGAISFVAVGFAALREANDQWDSGLLSLTLGILLNAVILAVRRTEARRAFWIGFALFGWGYLCLSLISSTESRLITTQALAYLEKANILGNRANVMRFIPDLDRMRAHNLSLDDLLYDAGIQHECFARRRTTPPGERRVANTRICAGLVCGERGDSLQQAGAVWKHHSQGKS